MKKIALISCTKYKKDYLEGGNDKNQDVQLFKLSYNYAKKNADEIYILSARYGLLRDEEYLASYNECLDYKSEIENKLWALDVMEKLNQYTDIHKDEFIILADRNYYKNFLKYLKNTTLPLLNLSIGERIQYLKESTSEEIIETASYGEKLHILFNSMNKYSFGNLDDIPFTNGVYIILDKKEKYEGMSRIVRVGTHSGENRLIVRLKKHFKEGAKDESVLRKNIGKAILDYNNLDYITIWSINFNDKRNEKKYSHLRNIEYEKNLEKMITYYMKERFEFVCFEIFEEEARNRLVEGILSTLAIDENFVCSEIWLGNYSPVETIRNGGVWVNEELNKEKLNDREIREIIAMCVASNQTATS
ncbi:MAG: hypothetical protein RSG52_09050 [Terrisporobacter sp.]|uniref:DUF6884 domain-containing protein n=1 Tax=Terrisporobacter sp. TaxID=1965305 RepID=UPI002FCA7866